MPRSSGAPTGCSVPETSQDGVAALVDRIELEPLFADGPRLIVLFEPVVRDGPPDLTRELEPAVARRRR